MSKTRAIQMPLWIDDKNKKMKLTRAEYMQFYRKNNPERHKKVTKEWREKNRARLRAGYKKWRDGHLALRKAIRTIQNHRKRGCIVQVTSKQLEALFKQTKHCPQCGIEFTNPRYQTVERIDDAKIMTMKTIKIVCLTCNLKNSWKPRKRLMVTREWVDQFMNAIQHCGRDAVIAGLNELNVEIVEEKDGE